MGKSLSNIGSADAGCGWGVLLLRPDLKEVAFLHEECGSEEEKSSEGVEGDCRDEVVRVAYTLFEHKCSH